MIENNHQSKEEQLIAELELLRREVAELKTEKAAFETQTELLEHLVAMARCSFCEEMLKATLQETVHVSSKLSGAEKGSLFLFNSNGVVTDSILTQEEDACQIGSILDKGLPGWLAGWVFHHHKVGLITDTETDDRWLIQPNQPYSVRSALAVPILRDDELLGIITLLHQEPGQFSPETAYLMQVAAHQIALVLENARLYRKLEESYQSLNNAKLAIEAYSEALDSELEKGRQIQRDFLPREIPQLPNWEIATCFYPARQVGGDFYDAFMLPGDYLGIVIADVCDKGVGAALFMALFRSLIRVFSGQTNLDGLSIIGRDEGLDCLIDPLVITDFNQINALKAVALTNNYIAQEHGEMNMFATLFFGVLNPANGCLTYINAGHEPLFIVGDSGVKKSLKSTGPVVGIMPNIKFKIQQVHLEPGDILIGYTDGVTEARAPSREFFSNKRLLSLLNQKAFSAYDLLEDIKTNLFTHIDNAQQFDDITMLAVRRISIT
ncbi:serine phosphatase [Nostoc commune NIES-4072]|uniref:Serine phosphatase n=1 Tax=Nostoc commune NIES-4072 TaxID=2005467 RepID=A0A2R5G667_NOSCO|nr:GAF domain-containing SpoIIE family protein phosphatase [Nostoc commune]BBD70589.1 serine phosphatase [Nostoc commune HK-02]GBG23244.1 serine phosphatase [Nostoc commune NIES-4072]